MLDPPSPLREKFATCKIGDADDLDMADVFSTLPTLECVQTNTSDGMKIFEQRAEPAEARSLQFKSHTLGSM